ncbi:MAG: 50S ribosomal protein L10 [Candidatus Aenigmarchaeota archaeon]|nr:50S ribosomal protein L10 [Candidatus Aenigmarchaeota archaeon]
MVSAKKAETLKSLVEQIEKYPVVGVLDMHKLPARQLHQIKEKLKGKAVIRMVKKRVIKLALEKSKKSNIAKLAEHIQNQPALLFSEGNPFELAQVIAASKSKAGAKAGDTAPDDIVVPEGPTNLPPGPAIGDLQRAKIQAGVEGDKIVVKKASTVAKKGDTISAQLADLLTKLGIEPMEISLNLVAVWDDGMIFNKDLLFIPKEHYVEQVQTGYAHAFNLAVNIGFVTPETVPVLLTKAHREAVALATEAGILTSETVGPVLAKANAEAEALRALVKEAPAEQPAAEQPAEKESTEEPAPGGQEDEKKGEHTDEEEKKG